MKIQGKFFPEFPSIQIEKTESPDVKQTPKTIAASDNLYDVDLVVTAQKSPTPTRLTTGDTCQGTYGGSCGGSCACSDTCTCQGTYGCN